MGGGGASDSETNETRTPSELQMCLHVELHAFSDNGWPWRNTKRAQDKHLYEQKSTASATSFVCQKKADTGLRKPREVPSSQSKRDFFLLERQAPNISRHACRVRSSFSRNHTAAAEPGESRPGIGRHHLRTPPTSGLHNARQDYVACWEMTQREFAGTASLTTVE